jgi:hypothetical protein
MQYPWNLLWSYFGFILYVMFGRCNWNLYAKSQIMRFRIPSFEIPTITNVCVWIYLHSRWIHRSFVNINHHWLVTPYHCTPWSSTVKPCFSMNRIPAIQIPTINENLLEPDTFKLWQQEKLSIHCITLECTFSLSKMILHVKHALYLGQVTLVVCT